MLFFSYITLVVSGRTTHFVPVSSDGLVFEVALSSSDHRNYRNYSIVTFKVPRD